MVDSAAYEDRGVLPNIFIEVRSVSDSARKVHRTLLTRKAIQE